MAYDIQTKTLGTKTGATEQGACWGPRLRSGTCQTFCTQAETNSNRLCEAALYDLCHPQESPLGHETMCACWLADDTYRRIQAKKMKDLGIDEKTDYAQKLREELQEISAPPVCWYGACKQSAMRPKFEQACPDNQFFICTQNMSDNIFDSAGGEQKHNQSCVRFLDRQRRNLRKRFQFHQKSVHTIRGSTERAENRGYSRNIDKHLLFIVS